MSFKQYAQQARSEYRAQQSERPDVGDYRPPMWPRGWYPCKVTFAQDGLVPKAGGKMVLVDLDVRNPRDDCPPSERRVEVSLYMGYEGHPSQQWLESSRRRLGALAEITGKDEPEKWVGAKLQVWMRQPMRTHNARGYANPMEATRFRPMPKPGQSEAVQQVLENEPPDDDSSEIPF